MHEPGALMWACSLCFGLEVELLLCVSLFEAVSASLKPGDAEVSTHVFSHLYTSFFYTCTMLYLLLVSGGQQGCTVLFLFCSVFLVLC